MLQPDTPVDPVNAAAVATILQALAHPLRLAIVCLLMDHNELAASAIEYELETSQPNLSHHLRILRQAKLVTMRRQGSHRFYRLSDPRAALIIRTANRPRI